jgi:biotin/methionine sulfoxide reductase
LTLDKGTSSLAQGPIAHTCMVQVEKYNGPLPALTAFQPPDIIENQ